MTSLDHYRSMFPAMPYLRQFAFLLFVSPAWASSYGPILDSITTGSVVVVGERHHETDSPRLFQEIVSSTVKHGLCPIIALEIASNQQTAIDSAVAGKSSIEDVSVPGIIDHPAYQTMLKRLIEIKHEGACLSFLAIDAGDEVNMNRDKWMASKIQEQGRDATILALLGNQHALQRVHWNHSRGMPSVSEILIDAGRNVRTYLQSWPSTCDSGRSGRFYDASKTEALFGVLSTFSAMNAQEPTSAAGIVNGVISWECDIPPRDNVPHFQIPF